MRFPRATNIAVFILFFGLALIEALKGGNWLESCIYLALGLLALLSDLKKSH